MKRIPSVFIILSILLSGLQAEARTKAGHSKTGTLKKQSCVNIVEECRTPEVLSEITVEDIRANDSHYCVSQNVVIRKEEPAQEDDVFVVVEQQAQYPGGMKALMGFLADNIRYPESAMENCIQGRVVVKFIVGKDGSISQAQVVKGVDPALDHEAVRVVMKMPRWEPGKNNGEAVRSWYTLPVTFRLQDK